MSEPRRCRVCGCTQYDACRQNGQGCWWVGADRCSFCPPDATAVQGTLWAHLRTRRIDRAAVPTWATLDDQLLTEPMPVVLEALRMLYGTIGRFLASAQAGLDPVDLGGLGHVAVPAQALHVWYRPIRER